jgi:hypothetical protein
MSIVRRVHQHNLSIRDMDGRLICLTAPFCHQALFSCWRALEVQTISRSAIPFAFLMWFWEHSMRRASNADRSPFFLMSCCILYALNCLACLWIALGIRRRPWSSFMVSLSELSCPKLWTPSANNHSWPVPLAAASTPKLNEPSRWHCPCFGRTWGQLGLIVVDWPSVQRMRSFQSFCHCSKKWKNPLVPHRFLVHSSRAPHPTSMIVWAHGLRRVDT